VSAVELPEDVLGNVQGFQPPRSQTNRFMLNPGRG
jgi:hypothetical protein